MPSRKDYHVSSPGLSENALKMMLIVTFWHAMTDLPTMGCFSAYASLAMTPEQSVTSREHSCLRSARAGHSRSMKRPPFMSLADEKVSVFTSEPVAK